MDSIGWATVFASDIVARIDPNTILSNARLGRSQFIFKRN
jgi:hypothetical protein